MNQNFPAGCSDPACTHQTIVPDGEAYRRFSCEVCGAEGPAIPARIRRALSERDSLGSLPELSDSALVIILEDLRSVHNIGSIMRSADAFAADLVVMTGISATPENPKLSRTALGAESAIPWIWRCTAMAALGELREQGMRIVALESTARAQHLKRAGLQSPVALVVGNEVAGVSSPVLDRADAHVEIPMRGIKSSLNAAVALGIAAWEIRNSALDGHDSSVVG